MVKTTCAEPSRLTCRLSLVEISLDAGWTSARGTDGVARPVENCVGAVSDIERASRDQEDTGETPVVPDMTARTVRIPSTQNVAEERPFSPRTFRRAS